MADDIQFNEEEQQSVAYQQEPKEKSLFVRLVLSTGIVSTDKGAKGVLLGIAATATILAIALPILFG